MPFIKCEYLNGFEVFVNPQHIAFMRESIALHITSKDPIEMIHIWIICSNEQGPFALSEVCRYRIENAGDPLKEKTYDILLSLANGHLVEKAK